MAARIEIRTDSGSLDLPVDFHKEFYITRQVHDLNNFQTRNADFTKSVQLPATPNNVRILGANAEISDSSSTFNNTILCSILMDGITVAPIAKLIYTKTLIDKDFTGLECVIYYGNFNMFDDIGGNSIADLNWADIQTNWDLAILQGKSSNTYLENDIVFPVVDWYDRKSISVIPNAVDIETSGFFLYARNIIERILGDAGYKLVVGDVPSDFNTIALACPVPNFFDLEQQSGARISEVVSSNANQQAQGTSLRAEFQLGGANGIWDFILNQFIVNESRDYYISMYGTYFYRKRGTGNIPSRFVIYVNGNEVDSISIDGPNTNNDPFFMSTTINLLAGDIVYAEIEASNAGQPDSRLRLLSGSTFLIDTTIGAASRIVKVSEHIPKIEQGTFIANILKLFNLFITANDTTRTLTIQSFDVLYLNDEIDMSDRLVIGNESIEKDSFLSSLGQYSEFKWQNDNLRRADFDVTKRYFNQVLSKRRTVIEMDFSACDNSTLYFFQPNDVYPKAKIPLVSSVYSSYPNATITFQADGQFSIDEEIGFKVGDYISGLGLLQLVMITNKIDEFSGVTYSPISVPGPYTSVQTYVNVAESLDPRLAILRQDGSETDYNLMRGNDLDVLPFTATSLTANWMESLKMSSIVDSHYSNITDALEYPQVIKAFFNLSALDVLNFDFTRPLYVSQFNAHFYVNKIEQFKLDSTTRLELVRINRVRDAEYIPPPSFIISILAPPISSITSITVSGGPQIEPGESLPFIGGSLLAGLGFFDSPLTGETAHLEYRNNPSNTIISEIELFVDAKLGLQLRPQDNVLWEGGDIDFQLVTRPL